jgi:sortase A
MRRPLGIALALAGLICLLWVAFAVFDQNSFQREQEQVLEKSVAAPTPTPPSAPAPAPVPKPRERLARQALVGRIEIPRLKLSAIVSEGDDEKTLKKAVGHLPDTPLPWEEGNSALAGHRDSFFRPLKNVRVGDEIQMTTPRGVFVYRVSETFITTPTNVSILKPRGRNELTLVTCYPFNFVGDAPDRFIVHAERLDGPSQANLARAEMENLAPAAPARNAIR